MECTDWILGLVCKRFSEVLVTSENWSCESSQSRDSQHLVDLPGVCKREDKAVQSLPLLPFRFLGALVFSFLRQRLPLAEAVIHLG